MADITTILQQVQSPDANIRQGAEEQLKQAQEQNYTAFFGTLAGEIANEQKPQETRRLAGLILKNALSARDEGRKAELQNKWLQQDQAFRGQIKQQIWAALGSPVPEVRHTSAQVVAKIAGAELPKKQWPDLIQGLQQNVASGNQGLKQSTLETLGFVCEELAGEEDALEEGEVNTMLTAVCMAMRKEEPDNEIRYAATVALCNALEFASENFEREHERNFIMQVTCEATVCADARVRQAAYEVLASVAANYYEKLQPYMTAIFDLTVKATKEDEEQVALQAIEFWSAVCEEETERMRDIADGEEGTIFHRFIAQALPMLVPMLLETLTKQEEGQEEDDDTWNLAMAGGTCLGLVANTVEDEVVDHVMGFIRDNISKPDWRLREAATCAFGSILEGPDPAKLAPVAQQALPFLLNAMRQDTNGHVKDTTAWTIGRIFEFVCSSELQSPIVTPANLNDVLNVLMEALRDKPHIAGKVCWALHNLATSFDEGDAPMRAALAPYFQGIVTALLTTSERGDAEQSLRMECYESLNEIIRASTPDVSAIIQQLIPVILQKLGATVDAPVASEEAKEKQAHLQGLLCGTLQVIIQKLGAQEQTKHMVHQFADPMMQVFLRVFGCRSATVHEEAMLAVGALAYSTGPQFEKYMQSFMPYVEMGLKNHEEHEVCNITVGVVGDLCHALEARIVPWCDGIVSQLLLNLQSSHLHRSVKPPILSCFGDLALATGTQFEKYLPYVVSMLQSATQLSMMTSGKDDEEMMDYNNMLRCGIFEAYTGLLQGFKDDKAKMQQLLQHAQFVMSFIEEVAKDKDRDDAVTRTMVGVMGDMADAMDQIGPLFAEKPFWKQLLTECMQEENEQALRDTADWTHRKIMQRVGGH